MCCVFAGVPKGLLNVPDSCIYYKAIHVYSPSPSPLPTRTAAAALSSGKALLLPSHGQLTAGLSVQSATSYFIRLENCCKAQLLAEAAARGRGETVRHIGKEEAEFTWDKTGDESHGWALGKVYFDRVERSTGGSYRV